jgi:putative spermidine/putrescine transport system substrate-binding protein
LTDTGCATNGFENFDKIWFWRTPTAKCEKESEAACRVPYSQWAKDYIAILGK